MAEIVYVLTNEYMPGLVKIGMTQRESVQTRIDELSRHSGVPVGSQLSFSRNSDTVATVAANNQIEFEGELTSLSASAVKVLNRLGSNSTALQGSVYWMYEGETLDERRQRIEAEQFESAPSAAPDVATSETYFSERESRADLPSFDLLMQRKTGEPP